VYYFIVIVEFSFVISDIDKIRFIQRQYREFSVHHSTHGIAKTPYIPVYNVLRTIMSCNVLCTIMSCVQYIGYNNVLCAIRLCTIRCVILSCVQYAVYNIAVCKRSCKQSFCRQTELSPYQTCDYNFGNKFFVAKLANTAFATMWLNLDMSIGNSWIALRNIFSIKLQIVTTSKEGNIRPPFDFGRINLSLSLELPL